MNKSIIFFIAIFSVYLSASEIDLSYAVIDELYSNENFNMIVKIKGGESSIKNLFIVMSSMTDGEEKRFEMSLNGNTGSVNIENSKLIKTDFYYYFEIIKKDNSVFSFPQIPHERLKNKVKYIKDPEYVKPDVILLSPENINDLMAEDFLFTMLVIGKVDNIRVILDGEDITEKCIIGARMVSYNPGKIFKPSKYRFDVVFDDVLIKTFYFDFRNSSYLKSFAKGAIGFNSCLNFLQSDSNSRIIDAEGFLDLNGSLADFRYNLYIGMNDFNFNNSSDINRYNVSMSYSPIKILIGDYDNCVYNSAINCRGAGIEFYKKPFSLQFNYGFKRTELLSEMLAENYYFGEDKVGAVKSGLSFSNYSVDLIVSRGIGYLLRDNLSSDSSISDNIVISSIQQIHFFSRGFIIEYGNALSSTSQTDSSNSNLFAQIPGGGVYPAELLKSYSHYIGLLASFKPFSLSLKYNDPSIYFTNMTDPYRISNRRKGQLKLNIPAFSKRMNIFASFDYNGKADTLFSANSFVSHPYSVQYTAGLNFLQKNLPKMEFAFFDKYIYGDYTALYSSRVHIYRFSGNISGDYLLNGMKADFLLHLDQVNYGFSEIPESQNRTTNNVKIYSAILPLSKVKIGLSFNSYISGTDSELSEKIKYSLITAFPNVLSRFTPEINAHYELSADDSSDFSPYRFSFETKFALDYSAFNLNFSLKDYMQLNEPALTKNMIMLELSIIKKF